MTSSTLPCLVSCTIVHMFGIMQDRACNNGHYLGSLVPTCRFYVNAACVAALMSLTFQLKSIDHIDICCCAFFGIVQVLESHPIAQGVQQRDTALTFSNLKNQMNETKTKVDFHFLFVPLQIEGVNDSIMMCEP